MDIDYSLYEDLNDFEVDTNELPDWIMDVMENIRVSNQGGLDCLHRFIYSYLKSEQLREITKNYVLLFVNREYVGIYKNEKIAYTLGDKLRVKGGKFSIIPMYVEISGSEKKETCLFTSAKIIKRINC